MADPRTVTVALDLPGGRWAEVEVDYLPDTPGRRSGHPDTWTPPEPGWAEPTSARVWHEDADEPETVEGAALLALLCGREDTIHDLARDAGDRP